MSIRNLSGIHRNGRRPSADAYRDAGPASLAADSPATEPGHLRRSPGFVDEHQAQRIEVRLGVEPGLAPSGGVGPLLLAGVCRFF
jgi:hypothetical protein